MDDKNVYAVLLNFVIERCNSEMNCRWLNTENALFVFPATHTIQGAAK